MYRFSTVYTIAHEVGMTNNYIVVYILLRLLLTIGSILCSSIPFWFPTSTPFQINQNIASFARLPMRIGISQTLAHQIFTHPRTPVSQSSHHPLQTPPPALPIFILSMARGSGTAYEIHIFKPSCTHALALLNLEVDVRLPEQLAPYSTGRINLNHQIYDWLSKFITDSSCVYC